MECAREELRKILKKCQINKVDIKTIKNVEIFLKANKKPESRAAKSLKVLIIFCCLAYCAHIYFSDLSTTVSFDL